MEAQLEELEQRLEALDCLARPTKQAILEYARAHFTPEELQRYLHDRLDFVERYLAPFDMPAFRKLCGRLATEEDLTAIQSELGLHEGGDHKHWFVLMCSNPAAFEIMCYSFANHLALPMPDLHPQEILQLVRMTEIQFQAGLLKGLGGKEETWRALERQLGLEGGRYEDPAEVRTRLGATLGEFPLYCQDFMVFGLADALVSSKDFDRSARLLVAHLGLDGLVPWTLDALEAHFQQHLDESVSGARTVCANLANSPMAHQVNLILRLPASFLAKLIGRLVLRSDRLPVQSQLRLTILNALLGTRTDAYQELDRLRCRVEELDEEQLWSLLEQWDWGLKNTNEQDAALEALGSYLESILAQTPDRESPEAANPFAGPEGTAFAYLLGLLARPTENPERDARRLRLLEKALAISDRNYVADTGLGEHLRQRLREVRPQAALRLLGVSYTHLTDAMPPAVAIGVLEEFLQLREALYDDTDRLREHLRLYWEGTQYSISSFMWVLLAFGLQLGSRPSQGLQVVLANLQAKFSAAGIKELREAVWGLTPTQATWVLGVLAQLLCSTGRFAEALPLCESLLQLNEPLYADRHALRRHFREDLKHLKDYAIALLVHGVTCGLAWGGANCERAILLLETFLGIDPELYDRRDDLRDLVNGLWSTREPSLVAGPLFQLAGLLAEQGRLDRVGVLLEALCNFHEEDYSDPVRLRNQVQERFAPVNSLAATMQSQALGLLVAVLDEQDRSDKLGPVLGILCADLSFLDVDSADATLPETRCLVLNKLLFYLGLSERDRGLDFCRRLVPFLRASIRRTQESFADRIRLLDAFDDVRSSLSFTVNYWIAQEPPQLEANRLRFEALCWEAELGQRVLLERFRVLMQVPVLGDGTALPAPGWPYSRALNLMRRPSANYSRLGCFGTLETNVPVAATTPSLHLEPSRFLERTLPREGIEPRHLAAALGPGVLLIRASFAAHDCLVWSAFRSDGQDLLLIASDEGKGQPEDRDQLRAAVTRHDEAIATLWAQWRQLCGRLQAAGLTNDLEQLDQTLGESARWSDLPDLWEELVHRARARGLDDLAGELERAFPDGWLPPAESQRSGWVAERKELWRQFWRDRLARPLDDATRAFIDEAAAVWPLEKLARHLDNSLDVVFQVDDVLHALPFAYLPVEGKPLCQQVRSVRSVFSVLLQDWQRELERKALQVPAPTTPKTMVVSWFDPNDKHDSAGDGAELLHRLLGQLAQQEHRCVVYAAAENPQGSRAWLAQGLRQLGPLQVVTVCGHGHSVQSGVCLADGVWDGKGCDLSQVEFLLQVSCSIGRARQTGLRDVDGFCIELTVSRARSVLAGKWPVHSVESAHFAHRIVHHYLTLREQLAPNELVSDRSLRAQAVNLTRCEILNGETADIGLNTAGGFELYGLG